MEEGTVGMEGAPLPLVPLPVLGSVTCCRQPHQTGPGHEDFGALKAVLYHQGLLTPE